MAISRRDILRGGAAAAATAAFGGTLGKVLADSPTRSADRLIIVFARGGWDTTLSIDPKPEVPTIDTPDGAVRRFADLPIWSHPTRPSVDAFFERWAERTAVVHGIEVRSFVHLDCEKRMLTGTPSDTAPDLGALAADCLGRDRPIPYLVLGGVARSGPLEALVGRVGATNQVLSLVDPRMAYPDVTGTPELTLTSGEQALVARFAAANDARLRATRGMRASNARRIEEFIGSSSRAEDLSAFVRQAGLGDRQLVVDPRVQLGLGVQALASELSQAVLVEVGGFDSHQNNHAVQTIRQEQLFSALTGLMTDLEEAGLQDDTTVAVMSEMGRTPLLNGQDGKDHWPTASAMLIGARVRGGRAYGATDDLFQGEALDLATGEIDGPDAKRIQTGNLIAGVLELVGVDPSELFPGVEPLRAFTA
ncbi:MAG: DUF1501 domain-containing protein [Sandaracinaceae bacterium]